MDDELIPFPFDGAPFACELHVKHPPSCAILDSTLPLGEPLAPLLPRITAGEASCGLLRDEKGRTRIIRGINVAYKVNPHLPLTDVYHPSLSVSRAELRLFAKLGFNCLRLDVPWAAVQPRRPTEDDDGIDEAYLATIRRFVDDCAAEGALHRAPAWRLEELESLCTGLYVLVSSHQDLYTATFAGNGFPPWSITSSWYTMAFPRPVQWSAATYPEGDPDGLPDLDSIGLTGKHQDDWGWLYVADQVARAFWGFYTVRSFAVNLRIDINNVYRRTERSWHP